MQDTSKSYSLKLIFDKYLKNIERFKKINFYQIIIFRFSPDLTEAIKEYSIWGAVLTEVDIDILTGEKHIRIVNDA